MKLTIEVYCDSLIDAGVLEEWLVDQQYKFAIGDLGAKTGKKNKPLAKRPTRTKVTPETIARAKNLFKMYPNYSDGKIAALMETGHSSQTVNRIRNGWYDKKKAAK